MAQQLSFSLPPESTTEVICGNRKVTTRPCDCRFFYEREHDGAEWRYVGGEDCGAHFLNYAFSL